MRCEPSRQGSRPSEARKAEGTARAQDAGKEQAWEKYDTISPHLRKEQCMRPVEQQVLQREWESLSAEDKAIRRAQRARRGERCSDCGIVGYFRRNCPTCPPVRYDVKEDAWRLLSSEGTKENNSGRCRRTAPPNTMRRGKHAPAEIEALPGVGGRGFLWGPLAAEGAARPFDWTDSRSGKGSASGSASIASAAGAIVVEIPSLSGTSNLSSGVISGLRRTLLWADSDVGVCPSTVSSFSDIPGGTEENVRAMEDPLEHDFAAGSSADSGVGNTKKKTACGISDEASGVGSTNERTASGINGAVDLGGRGGNGSRMDAVQELAWRWADFSSPTRTAMESPISCPKGDGMFRDETGPIPPQGQVGKQSPVSGWGRHIVRGNDQEDTLGENPTTRDNQGDRNAMKRKHPLSSVPLSNVTSKTSSSPPRGSYLQLRNDTILTVQENLHLALARLADAARKQVNSVASEPSATEILRNPRGGPPPERYYGASTRKDFQEFFDAEEQKADRQEQVKAHTHLGGLREEGKLKYVFDRTSHSGVGSLAAHLRGDFQPQPKGYRGTNIHAVTAWRRPNTTLDRYAVSGRDALKRVAQSDKALKCQAAWVGEQKEARKQRRQRANHLLEVFKSELLSEQMREVGVLRLPRKEQRLHVAEAMKDRVVAADRIMRTIKRYGLMRNMEDAHYIRYAFDAACRAGLAPGRSGTAIANASAPHDVSTGSSMRKVLCETVKAKGDIERGDHPSSEETLTHSQKSAGTSGKTTQGQQSGRNGGGRGGSLEKRNSGRLAARTMVGVQCDNDKMSPYARLLLRPALKKQARITRRRGKSARSLQTLEGKASVAAQEASRRRLQLERLRTFRLAGHPLRRGMEDDTTTVPALIPIPQGFGSGKVSEGEYKSFAAGKIVETLRASQVDGITGRTAKISVPLWHRATEEVDSSTTGSVLYSDLIGHTYSVLVGPKRAEKK